jgi:RNA polymerase sigma-70 factor, ECF subfamily
MGSPTTSFDLIERIRKGDRDAFSLLFGRYSSRLAVWAHYRMSSELRQWVEVEDILQETLLRAFREFDHFAYQGPGSFMGWLARIAEHVVVDTARHHGRARRHAELVRFRSESNPQGPEPLDSETPSRLFGERERLQQLIRSLDALPENYRRAIVLSRIEGLTTQELADRLGKSRESAALLLHRALKALRQNREAGQSS